jgi:hypothetical protein
MIIVCFLIQSQITDVTTAVSQLGILIAGLRQDQFIIHHSQNWTQSILWIGAIHHLFVDNFKLVVVCRNPLQVFRAIPIISVEENFDVGDDVELFNVKELIVAQVN